MKRKEISGLLIALGLLFGCSCFVGCQQTNPENPSDQQPGGDDGENTGTEQSAKITVFSTEPSAAKIVFMGSAVIGKDAPKDAEVGIELSTSVVFPAATTERKKAVVAEGSSTYTLEFTGLKFDTKYYYRTYTVSGGKTEYGTALPEQTANIEIKCTRTENTETSITLYGTVSELVDGIEYGIEYASSENNVGTPEGKSEQFTPDSDKNFSITLNNLEAGGKYYGRFYADQSGNRRTGEIGYFETSYSGPTASVIAADIEGARIKLKIRAHLMPGYSVGAELATREDFAGCISHTLSASEEMEDGVFWWQDSKLKLLPSTKYYYRTFIKSSTDTKYGETGTFTTEDLPYVVDATAESNSVTLQGKFIGDTYNWGIKEYDNDKTVSYGILCSSAQQFDITTSGVKNFSLKVEEDMANWTFVFQPVTWTGLSSATKYYYRSYYKVLDKYVYGEIKSVTTK